MIFNIIFICFNMFIKLVIIEKLIKPLKDEKDMTIYKLAIYTSYSLVVLDLLLIIKLILYG